MLRSSMGHSAADRRLSSVADQELRTRVRYWEGAVDARGTSHGVGYLEMTGYAK